MTKIDPAGTTLLYSTYLGGSANDFSSAIAVDSSGAVYTGGWTMSTDFPLTQPLQVLMYGPDAFITKISPGTPPVLSLAITPDIFFVPQGTTLAYTAAVTNTTAAKKCFQYWENITLQNGSTYPATGELFGPISLCLDAGATQSVPLTKGVPLSAPMALYALNAFVGAYGTPGHHVTVNESHFTFNVTASGPAPLKTETSWRLLEKGFK